MPYRQHTLVLASFLAILTMATMLVLPLATSLAQGTGQLQARPTPTPTEPFNPPLAANPTPTPTPDDPAAPGELAPNPTEAPTLDQPLEVDDPATLTIRKGVCDDAGFDPTTAVGDNAFAEACGSPDGEFEFTVSATGFAETASTSLGEVTFEVPVGIVSISETIPAGWGDPAVFCWSDFLPTPAETPFIGNGPTWDVQAGEQIECHWYNIANGGQSHTILVSTRECPPATDLTSDYWSLATTCTDPLPATGVSLTPGGALVTDGNGMAEWTGVDLGDSGELQIDQDTPAGFGEPAVWCTSYPVSAADAQDFDFSFMESAGGQITATPEQHEPFIFACTFFNLADDAGIGSLVDPSAAEGDAGSTITIDARICPAGTEQDQLLATYHAACTDPLNDAGFTLTHGGGAFPDVTTDGLVAWDLVPEGPFGVQQETPAGDGNPYVFCGHSDEPGGNIPHISQANAADGLVEGTIAGGPYDTLCYWFILEGEPEHNRIDILTFSCPAGTAVDLDFPTYVATCTEQQDGIEFRVTSDFGIAVAYTAMGSVSFPDIASGTAGVQETIPDGYGSPKVFCGTDMEFGPYAAPTGYWTYDFIDDGTPELVECHVFNIPGEPGSITLLKWTCPAGYDLHAEGANPQADCIEATNGVGFQFGAATGLDAEAVLQTTGAVIPGGVVFDDLDAGAWKAVEIVPDGMDHVFVLECTGHIMGVLQPYPLAMGNVLTIDLDAGEHLTCQWFNVPEVEGGELTLLKYTCSTPEYVSFVDCQIEESGVTFDLMVWNAVTGDWDLVETAVTDGFGQITWQSLPAGEYTAFEHDATPCLVSMAQESEGPNGGIVIDETSSDVLEVFNCTGEPGIPGDTPHKYPDTGVPPTM